MPAVGILDVSVIFASCVDPNAGNTLEPGSMSIVKAMFSSTGVGGGGVGVEPEPLDLEQEIAMINIDM